MKKTPKTFQTVYIAKVNYIRKLYSDCLSPEQKKAVERLEAICKDIWKNIKEMNLSAQEGLEIFHSTILQLKYLKRQIENTWKLKKTDYEAFRLRATRLSIPIVPIQEIISITKVTEPPKFEDLKNVNFPILNYENLELCKQTSNILKQTTFAVQQSLPPEMFQKLVIKICKSYNVVSYHNFSHAFSLFLMLNQSYELCEEFKDFVSSFELFCALIAALSHDSGHKGTNNLYEIKKNTEKARKYSNQSVLENMHISNLFKIFRESPDLDIISCIKDPLLRQRAKRILINCVLATDMTKHNASLDIFAAKRKATEDYNKIPTRANENLSFQKKRLEDRQSILEYIVHSCDIGNPCLEFKGYMNWAALLTQEFDDQTKKEAENGLEVTGFLRYIDKPSFYKGQLGFSKIFVLPLWKELTMLWPSFGRFSDQVELNIAELQKIIEGYAITS